LGGKALVALDQTSGLILGMATDLDGETNEAKLVPDLVTQIRPRIAGPILWVADRQFYALSHYDEFTARPGDHFLTRYHSQVKFTPDPERPEREGKDRHGRDFRQQWGWLGSGRQRREVRMLTIARESEDFIVVTSLLDADQYPADDLLELYFKRWGIERVFQKVTEVFQLKRLIGTTVKATMFQLAFCMLLYNMTLVVGAHVVEQPKPPPKRGKEKLPEKLTLEQLSLEMLFDDIKDQLIALTILADRNQIITMMAAVPTADAMRQKLRTLLSHLWCEIWRKCPSKKGRPKPIPNNQRPSQHRSIHRLYKEFRSNKSDAERS